MPVKLPGVELGSSLRCATHGAMALGAPPPGPCIDVRAVTQFGGGFQHALLGLSEKRLVDFLPLSTAGPSSPIYAPAIWATSASVGRARLGRGEIHG